jgi:dolichol-phosphate mannosyltransferase
MSSNLNKINLIVPIFNEQKNLIPFFSKTIKILSDNFSKIQFIFIDDGSTDSTEAEIHKLKTSDNIKIKYIKFTRNHGKEIAMKSGIDNVETGLCAIIDGDLQHPPEKINEAYEKIKDGYNIVHISRNKDIGSIFRRLGSKLFDKLINLFSFRRIYLTDFKLLDDKAISIIKNYSEVNYFNRGIVDLIGLKSTEIFYIPDERKFGKSKFSLTSLTNLAIDGVISVSIKPLRISIYFGLSISVLSIFYGLFLLYEKIFLGQPIPGFATLAIAMFFLGGLQLMFLGIIGEYIGKIFLESKRRPQYLIEYIKEF